MVNDIGERVASLETQVYLMKETYNHSLERLNAKMDKLIGAIETDIVRNDNRLMHIEKRFNEDSGKREIISDYIKPLMLIIGTILITKGIEVGFIWMS